MGRLAVKIELSEKILFLLKQESNKRKLEKHFHDRFRIIILCSEGIQNKDIVLQLSYDCRTVGIWRNRWYDRTKDKDITLDAEGKELSDIAIISRIKEILSDNYRSGCPPRITEQMWSRLQALACDKPENYGLPFTTWTHEELSKQAKRLGIDICPSHYGVLLKKRITST
jgi:hypothetical protein